MISASATLLAVVVLGAGCGSATPPTATPSLAPTAVPTAASTATPTVVPGIVGEWAREQRCEEIVALVTEAGMESWVLDFAAAFVPGATGGADIADPSRPCEGAVPLRHSHFFTADGRFGSRDQFGNQVDNGTYELVDERTFVIANDLGSGTLHYVTFHYEIVGDTIMFSPVIPDCRPGCFESVWSVSVAYEGLPWARTD